MVSKASYVAAQFSRVFKTAGLPNNTHELMAYNLAERDRRPWALSRLVTDGADEWKSERQLALYILVDNSLIVRNDIGVHPAKCQIVLGGFPM